MLFVLVGPSYVGKKTAISHFVKLYSFSSIIPYTTKDQANSIGEVEGVQYHYVPNTTQYRHNILNSGDYIYDTPFNCADFHSDVLYAYKKKDILEAIDSYSNFIIHASVENAKQIYDTYHIDKSDSIYIIFLKYVSSLTKEFFKKRCPHDINSQQFKKRFCHAEKEIQFYIDGINNGTNIFSKVLESDSPFDMCEKLQDFILPKLEVMPTSPDKIPGPLSDTDLLYTFEHRDVDRLMVKVNNSPLDVDEFKKRLCGCGIHLTLSSSIRRIKLSINNTIDMAEDPEDIKNQLKHIYCEETVGGGYFLKPNETIFCTSNEEVDVPRDMYAIVSSRFSYSQLGLSIELGTSIIQAGHKGRVHFQIKNQTPNSFYIYPGIVVLQLVFFRTILHSSESNTVSSYSGVPEVPISLFRDKEDILSSARKKPSRILGSINQFLKIKIQDLLGLTSIFAIVGIIGTKAFDFTNNIMTIFLNSNVTIAQIALISIFVWILNTVFSLSGRIVVSLFKNLIIFFRKVFTSNNNP